MLIFFKNKNVIVNTDNVCFVEKSELTAAYGYNKNDYCITFLTNHGGVNVPFGTVEKRDKIFDEMYDMWLGGISKIEIED